MLTIENYLSDIEKENSFLSERIEIIKNLKEKYPNSEVYKCTKKSLQIKSNDPNIEYKKILFSTPYYCISFTPYNDLIINNKKVRLIGPEIKIANRSYGDYDTLNFKYRYKYNFLNYKESLIKMNFSDKIISDLENKIVKYFQSYKDNRSNNFHIIQNEFIPDKVKTLLSFI